MIVVDASAIVELLLQADRAAAVRFRLARADESLHAPHLLDVEVVSAVRRYHLGGDLSAQRGREALSDLSALPVTRYPHDVLLPRIWELRHSLSAYNAVYVALAELLDAPLLTLDRRLASARGHQAQIELLLA
ncbi:MAG TPA: type II toxin-antitoxin system VapC family toxin [Solirubrobacterales bacterium]|nr:type II toxin-antitoxin system VapC family toxin [Solirubrobacterales bacterium]